jgi:hypothetical protein
MLGTWKLGAGNRSNCCLILLKMPKTRQENNFQTPQETRLIKNKHSKILLDIVLVIVPKKSSSPKNGFFGKRYTLTKVKKNVDSPSSMEPRAEKEPGLTG